MRTTSVGISQGEPGAQPSFDPRVTAAATLGFAAAASATAFFSFFAGAGAAFFKLGIGGRRWPRGFLFSTGFGFAAGGGGFVAAALPVAAFFAAAFFAAGLAPVFAMIAPVLRRRGPQTGPMPQCRGRRRHFAINFARCHSLPRLAQ
ncbi:MAG: hypothetical protein NVS9B10_06350 [Nevskia sp.]